MTSSGCHIACLIISVIAALGLTLATPDNTLADLNDGLVGYWSFDEGSGDIAYDYSGYGRHGTIIGASWVDGISGQALYFDGVNDYVIADPLNVSYVSISAWVNHTEFAASRGIVSNSYFSLDGYMLYHQTDPPGDRFKAWVATGDGLFGLLSPSILSTNKWYHVVMTYDGNKLKHYVDGQFDSQTSASGEIKPISHGFRLLFGAMYNGGFRFNGVIDEIRIYNRALREEEILDLYWSVNPDPQDPYSEGDQSDVSGTDADPVNTATGGFFYQQTDLSITGRGSPLIFKRYYNSKAAAPGRRSPRAGHVEENDTPSTRSSHKKTASSKEQKINTPNAISGTKEKNK